MVAHDTMSRSGASAPIIRPPPPRGAPLEGSHSAARALPTMVRTPSIPRRRGRGRTGTSTMRALRAAALRPSRRATQRPGHACRAVAAAPRGSRERADVREAPPVAPGDEPATRRVQGGMHRVSPPKRRAPRTKSARPVRIGASTEATPPGRWLPSPSRKTMTSRPG